MEFGKYEKLMLNQDLVVKTSTDDGRSWSGASLIATHGLKHLIDKILIKNGKTNQLNLQAARDDLGSQIVVDEEKFRDVIDICINLNVDYKFVRSLID